MKQNRQRLGTVNGDVGLSIGDDLKPIHMHHSKINAAADKLFRRGGRPAGRCKNNNEPAWERIYLKLKSGVIKKDSRTYSALISDPTKKKFFRKMAKKYGSL